MNLRTIRPLVALLAAVALLTAGVATPAGAAAAPTRSPVLATVAPPAGPTVAGEAIVLTGRNLATVTKVTFASSTATIQSKSATNLVVTAPAHAAGSVTITATSPTGKATAQYTYVAAPEVTALTPTSAAANTRPLVWIRGKNLLDATEVKFGTTTATIIGRSLSTGTLVLAPRLPAGKVPVTVTTRYGGTSTSTSKGEFTYRGTPVAPAPNVTALTPNTGTTDGGTPVTINGTGFTGVTAVLLGDIPGTGLVVTNATTLTVTTPAGTAGATPVRVVTDHGISPDSATASFTYVTPPSVLTSLSPDHGPDLTASSVTLTGTGLAGTTEVLFGDAPATIGTVTATAVTVTTPPLVPGPTTVTLTAPGGQATTTYTVDSPEPIAEAEYVPAASTVTLTDVLSVAAGPQPQEDGTKSSDPWQLIVPSPAPVSVGTAVYVPPGTDNAPTGLAGRTSAVNDNGDGTTALTLGQVPLNSIMDSFSVHYAGPLASAEPVAARGLAAASASESTIAFPSIKASALDCEAPGVSGSFSLSFENVRTHFDVGVGGLFERPHAFAWVSYEAVVAGNVTGASGTTCKLSLAAAGRLTRTVVTQTGLSVAFTPDVHFELSAKGTITVSQRLYQTVGITTHADGTFHPTYAASADPVEVSANAALHGDVFAGAQIRFGVLDTSGVAFSAGLAADANALFNNTAQLCIDVKVGLQGQLYLFFNNWFDGSQWRSVTFDLNFPPFADVRRCISILDLPPDNSDDPPPGGDPDLPAGAVRVHFTGTVTGAWDTITDLNTGEESPGGMLPEGVAIGSIVTGTYTYRLDTPDTFWADDPAYLPVLGDYQYTEAPYGATLQLGDRTISTSYPTDGYDPFTMHTVHWPAADHFWWEVRYPVASDGTRVDSLQWNSSRDGWGALASDALPSGPLNLSLFDSNTVTYSGCVEGPDNGPCTPRGGDRMASPAALDAGTTQTSYGVTIEITATS